VYSLHLIPSSPPALLPPPALGILIPRETLAGTAHNRHLALSSITFPSRTSVARNQSSSGGRGRRRKAGGREESALPPLVLVDDVVVVRRVEGREAAAKASPLMMMCVAGRQARMMRSLYPRCPVAASRLDVPCVVGCGWGMGKGVSKEGGKAVQQRMEQHDAFSHIYHSHAGPRNGFGRHTYIRSTA